MIATRHWRNVIVQKSVTRNPYARAIASLFAARGMFTSRTTLPFLAAQCVAAILVAGCAATPEKTSIPAALPPKVRLGPVIELLKGPTVRDNVRAVASRDGSVHVLIASTELHAIHEIVVPRSGPIERRTIRSDGSPSKIDAAFDARGRLHVLIDTEHLVAEGRAWRRVGQTPWRAAGLETVAAGFVPGAPDLIWKFSVSGRAVGAASRMDVYGFGGFGAGIIWPWFTQGTRAVVVAETETGFGPWVVIEPQGNLDTSVVDATADAQGNVHLVYTKTRGGLAAEATYRYVKVDAASLRSARDAAPAPAEPGKPSGPFKAVEGRQVDKGSTAIGESLRHPPATPMPRSFKAVVARDAGDTLHAALVAEALDPWWGKHFPIRYFTLIDNAWSAPVDLGFADVSSFWGYIWAAVDIAGAGRGAAFVVWPMEHAIVGRWVEQIP